MKSLFALRQVLTRFGFLKSTSIRHQNAPSKSQPPIAFRSRSNSPRLHRPPSTRSMSWPHSSLYFDRFWAKCAASPRICRGVDTDAREQIGFVRADCPTAADAIRAFVRSVLYSRTIAAKNSGRYRKQEGAAAHRQVDSEDSLVGRTVTPDTSILRVTLPLRQLNLVRVQGGRASLSKIHPGNSNWAGDGVVSATIRRKLVLVLPKVVSTTTDPFH